MRKGVNTDMKFDSVKYFFKDSFKSIVRNKTLSMASVATVAATFFIFGIVSLVIVNVNKAVDELGSKVEARVYLKDDIKKEELEKLEKALKATPGVVEVRLESKDQALDNVKNQLDDTEKSLMAGFDKKNPFPSSYIVRVKNPESIDNVVKKIDGLSGIEKVKDARDLISQVTKITNSVTIAGLIGSVVFILVSLFLIGNTIKITVFSRKREIGIMKYVGATDWFIRWPFIIEGVILGVIGALLSILIVFCAYALLQSKSANAFLGFSLISSSYIFKVLIWEFILGGILIGSIGSILSMRKFLKV